MTRIRLVTVAASCFAGLAVLLALGACYTSKFALGPKERAVVDRKFVGNWEIADPDQPGKPPVVMLIRNIDDHQYYVEWDEHGDKGPNRFTGFVVDVKGVSFAHLRPLSEDGEISEECIITRVGLTSDDKLTIRQLADNDKEFWKQHPVDSAATLRKAIEENLNNEQMYEANTAVGTRVQK
jgi:hypothetical protein